MNRRDALKQTALLTGYALSASTIAAVMNGCKASGEPGWVPQFLTEEQGATVAQMAECIIPKTDTPGAKDVLVHEFIDLMLKDYVEEEEQGMFIAGLEGVDAKAQEAHDKNFIDCTDEQQFELLQAMHVAEKEQGEEAGPPFFRIFRQAVVAGYFTSEKVGTEVLSYDPIPGDYDGCYPLDQVGNNWSLR
jgi:hypothetical protein